MTTEKALHEIQALDDGHLYGIVMFDAHPKTVGRLRAIVQLFNDLQLSDDHPIDDATINLDLQRARATVDLVGCSSHYPETPPAFDFIIEGHECAK